MSEILSIIKDPTLTFNQRFSALSKAAENSIDPITPTLSPKTRELMEKEVIWDMGEGNAPFRPRYVVPDYRKFMENGSEFLMLQPPKDIWEACANLGILYHHVPAAGGTLVYMGHLDSLLEPFITDEEEARKAIRLLLTHLDRTIPDAFCHCDIGPKDTKAGRIILELTAEMQRPVPNMTMIYNEEESSDAFTIEALKTALTAAKPSFVNDKISKAELGEYAVVSCYNLLPLGGGGLCLGRLNMKKMAELATSEADLFDRVIPECVAAQCEWMEARVKFIIDDSNYFGNSFLAEEGLIYQDRFVAMFGFTGLAECVNTILGATEQKERFGHSAKADDLGERIMDKMEEELRKFHSNYCKYYLHGQVGVDNDHGVTPATRIPVGEEPEMPIQLAQSARMQKHCVAGVGDIYPCDESVKRNPQYLLDIMKGAFNIGVRYISFYTGDADVVRVTGYLVKRSDMEKLKKGNRVLDNSTILGIGAADNCKALGRRVRSLNNA